MQINNAIISILRVGGTSRNEFMTSLGRHQFMLRNIVHGNILYSDIDFPALNVFKSY